MPELRKEQFHELARRLDKPDSGFSIHVETGHEPKTGYMVSQPGGNRKVRIPASGDDVEGYASTHSEELSEPDAYMGAWRPGRRKKADFDISARFPNKQRKPAMREMVMNKEEAAYHLDPKLEYGGEDVNNVLHPANASPNWPSPKLAAAHLEALGAAHDHYSAELRKKQGRPPIEEERRSRQAR